MIAAERSMGLIGLILAVGIGWPLSKISFIFPKADEDEVPRAPEAPRVLILDSYSNHELFDWQKEGW